MRFAGTPSIAQYMKGGPDLGAAAQNAAKTRSAIRNAATDLEGQVGAAGVTAAGQVEAASIVGAAQTSLANAQGNAAMMEGIGGIASSAIGAFGGGGGGGGGYSLGSPITFKSPAVANPNTWSQMSSAVSSSPFSFGS